MVHISRGIRWDSDHTVIQGDDLSNFMLEMKRSNYFQKISIGLDYFDASINRVATWVIGLRATGKAILSALLEPSEMLEKSEANGDYASRLALMEEFKNLPINVVWDEICRRLDVPVSGWL